MTNTSGKTVLIIVVVFYAGGILGLTLPSLKEHIELLTPVALLMNIALLGIYHKPWTSRHIAVFATIAITGFMVEVAGVASGLVFGHYQYGHVLGIKLFDTPLIIGVNWLMLIYFTYHLLGSLNLSRTVKVLIGSLIMLSYDYILEPVAIEMNMWNWSGSSIPIQNYIAWFIISSLFLIFMHLCRLRVSNTISNKLFFIQTLFILSLNILYRFV